MKRKLFFQIFCVSFFSVLVMFLFGVLAVQVNAKTTVRERLEKETELACALVNDDEDFVCFDRYRGDDDFRVTLFDLEGNVLYESDTQAPLENHFDREEVRNALQDKPKAVERYSETFGCKMTYYALKTELADGTPIILRLAIKNARIRAYLDVALPILAAVLAVTVVAAIFLSNWLSGKVTEPFLRVNDSLRSLNAGAYAPIVTTSEETELYSVLNEINALNANTHAQFQKIQEEHRKLNTVLENVSQGIVAIDEDKKIIFANRRLQEIFSAVDNVTGKDFIYLIDDLPLCEKIARHLGENYASEYVYKDKILSVLIRKVENGSADNVYSIVIITDVTQEKAIAKQKSDFFANASHELKTPVAVVQGLSEILLSKDGLNEDARKRVARIHEESARLAALLADMLDLSRLERGERESVSVPVALRELAEEVLSELSPKLAEKKIAASAEGDGVVCADRNRLFEVMENLCTNAVNYNKEGGSIVIKIQNDRGRVALSVSDTGIGIEKEHLPRLCERFYRVDKSRSKKTGGTGLGLAIVKHICALYNAELSIESEVDVGTTVTVIFPNPSEE